MKSKVSSLVFVFVATVMTAFADVPASLEVVSASASVYKVHYKTKETGNVRITIYSSDRHIMFTEVLSNVGSFIRPYNFSALEEGAYTIELKDRNGKQLETVNYTKEKVTSLIRVTEMADGANKYKLNITNNGTEEVRVSIYENYTLLYQETITVTGNHGTIYNLSKLKLATDAVVVFEVVTSSGKEEKAVF